MFTDGACLGNPGPGGYGVLLRYQTIERSLQGGYWLTTNNRMELLAAIIGLEALRAHPCEVHLYTDSRYVQDGITKWLPRWERTAFTKKGGGAVKNRDLWERLALAARRHHVSWHWVKGHAGHPENELVDGLAGAAARAPSAVDTGYQG